MKIRRVKLPKSALQADYVHSHRDQFTQYNRLLRGDWHTRFEEIAGWLTSILKRTPDPLVTRMKLREAVTVLVEEGIYSPNIPIAVVEEMLA